MSFRISITPSRRAAGRFVAHVRRELQKALALEEARGPEGVKQADIARAIGVNRSVIHRELRGHADLTLGRVAELAWAMGRMPKFELAQAVVEVGANRPTHTTGAYTVSVSAASSNGIAELISKPQVTTSLHIAGAKNPSDDRVRVSA